MSTIEIKKSPPLSLSGDVQYEIYKAYSEFKDGKCSAVLIIKFVGEHGESSGGNCNSNFMQVIVAAGIALNCQDAIVFDLTELTYEFGNSLMSVLVLPQKIKGKSFCTNLVVSEKCENGLKSLQEFEGIKFDMFKSLTEAVESTLNKVKLA